LQGLGGKLKTPFRVGRCHRIAGTNVGGGLLSFFMALFLMLISIGMALFADIIVISMSLFLLDYELVGVPVVGGVRLFLRCELK
jgi:hypothetical protein